MTTATIIFPQISAVHLPPENRRACPGSSRGFLLQTRLTYKILHCNTPLCAGLSDTVVTGILLQKCVAVAGKNFMTHLETKKSQTHVSSAFQSREKSCSINCCVVLWFHSRGDGATAAGALPGGLFLLTQGRQVASAECWRGIQGVAVSCASQPTAPGPRPQASWGLGAAAPAVPAPPRTSRPEPRRASRLPALCRAFPEPQVDRVQTGLLPCRSSCLRPRVKLSLGHRSGSLCRFLSSASFRLSKLHRRIVSRTCLIETTIQLCGLINTKAKTESEFSFSLWLPPKPLQQ